MAKAPPFNPQTAKVAQKLAVEARLRNKLAALEAERNPPQPTAILPEELNIVQAEITRIAKQLADDMSPKDRAQLAKALDTMLDRKRILEGKPLPGSRRPPQERATLRTVEPESEPVPIVASTPL